MNLFENRLYAIEKYYEEYESEKVDLVSYAQSMPTDKPEGYSWISDEGEI